MTIDWRFKLKNILSEFRFSVYSHKDENIMLTESDRAFFQPKWRRITATLFCIAWSILEWVSNEPVWAIVAAGITFYCLWHFFYKFEDNKDTPSK